MESTRFTNRRMKRYNIGMILKLLREESCLTRSELARRTGLTTAAVANFIKHLTDRGYVEEIGDSHSTGGRKPKLISLCADAFYAVGLELSTTHVRTVVINLRARVLASCEYSIDPDWQADKLIDCMVDCVREVIRQSGLEHSRIGGLGLAVPGPTDYVKGIMLNPPNFTHMKNVPILKLMREKTGIETYICKKTTGAALAEYWFGGALGMERVFALYTTTCGIGGSFLQQGHVYDAKGIETMDIGHTSVNTEGGFLCNCGNRGCLEAQVSASAIVRYANEFNDKRKNPYSLGDLETILRRASEGEPSCAQALDNCSRYLVSALRNIVLLLRPDNIFVGGNLFEFYPKLIESLREEMSLLKYPDCAGIAIEPFSFGKMNCAIGSTAPVFEKMLSLPEAEATEEI